MEAFERKILETLKKDPRWAEDLPTMPASLADYGLVDCRERQFYIPGRGMGLQTFVEITPAGLAALAWS